MDDSTRFSNYIIKKIVGHVDFDEATGDFSLQKVYMTDDILHDILEEGKRYGMPEEQVRSTVYRISSNIVTSPSITVHYSDLDSRKIPQGTHFELHFHNKTFGKFHVGLVAAGKGLFVIVQSDVNGLEPFDVVFSEMPVWNLFHAVEFHRFYDDLDAWSHDDACVLGELEYYAIYTPSVIHEIHDSQSDYSFEEKWEEQKQKDNRERKLDEEIAMLWKDKDWWDVDLPDCQSSQIVFTIDVYRKCLANSSVPFRIVRSGAKKAILMMNPFFCVPKRYTAGRNAIGICCKGDLGKEINVGTAFRTLSPGMLKYDEKTDSWKLVKKMSIETYKSK